MEEKQRFNVTIAGRPYTIVGNRAQEHMDAVIEIVNTQISQLLELAPHLSMMDHSILMAVNAVSDQLLKEAKIVELETEIAQLKESLQHQATNGNIPYRKRG